MRSKETASVRSNLVNDTDALSDNILELVVVILELLFLEQDDLGTFGDVDGLAGQALGFTDKSQDLTIEIDVELEVLVMADEEGGL